MGDAAVKLEKANRRRDLAKRDKLSPDQEQALKTIRREAKENGATLASGGKGGLDPRLVLGVFRRDKWHCKSCGGQEMLSMHHKGGIEESEWLKKKGHSNDPNNLVTICEACHDKKHEKAREEGVDSGG